MMLGWYFQTQDTGNKRYTGINPPKKMGIDPYKFPYLRTFMEEIANEDKNVAIIKTSMDKSWLDYPKHSDNVHYNSEGQKRLGIAFANKLIELIN